jgi:hypothetical protein
MVHLVRAAADGLLNRFVPKATAAASATGCSPHWFQWECGCTPGGYACWDDCYVDGNCNITCNHYCHNCVRGC